MIYTNILNKYGTVCEARSTDFEARTEDDMPIRIKRRDKTPNAAQVAEDSRVSTPL